MPTTRKIDLGVHTVFTNLATGNGIFNMLQTYMPAIGFSNCRISWEHQLESQASMLTRPGYQLADVDNTVVSTNLFGTDVQTGPGVKFGSGFMDISASTQARQLIRFGLFVQNASGTNVNCVRVHVWLEYEV